MISYSDKDEKCKQNPTYTVCILYTYFTMSHQSFMIHVLNFFFFCQELTRKPARLFSTEHTKAADQPENQTAEITLKPIIN